MRVAVVQYIVDPARGGGTAAKSLALARALAQAGVPTRLITTSIGLHDSRPPSLAGVDVHVLPSSFERFPVPRRGTRAVERLLDGCDAVLLMNHWTVSNALAYHAARRRRLPFVLCPAGALRIQGRSQLLKRAYQRVVGRRMVQDAGAVIATTAVEASQFREDGVPLERIRIIPNGIDPLPSGLTAEEFRARFQLPEGPLLLFMGRLAAIKGPDLLLDAFARVAGRYPDWTLVVAGRDEGIEPALRTRAAAAGIMSRVRFLGHLDTAEGTGAYRAASLLVIPSRHEAMSLVALEAGINGTPVLLTDACGFDEVEAAGGGQVVPPSADALAGGLDDLLQDPAALPAMGARLRELVVRTFSWSSVVQQYVDLFEGLLRDGVRGTRVR